MKKYINPTYETELVESSDVIMTSGIKDAGTGSVGNITGDKGVFESPFESLL